jgi:hypothetical protein
LVVVVGAALARPCFATPRGLAGAGVFPERVATMGVRRRRRACARAGARE